MFLGANYSAWKQWEGSPHIWSKNWRAETRQSKCCSMPASCHLRSRFLAGIIEPLDHLASDKPPQNIRSGPQPPRKMGNHPRIHPVGNGGLGCSAGLTCEVKQQARQTNQRAKATKTKKSSKSRVTMSRWASCILVDTDRIMSMVSTRAAPMAYKSDLGDSVL